MGYCFSPSSSTRLSSIWQLDFLWRKIMAVKPCGFERLLRKVGFLSTRVSRAGVCPPNNYGAIMSWMKSVAWRAEQLNWISPNPLSVNCWVYAPADCPGCLVSFAAANERNFVVISLLDALPKKSYIERRAIGLAVIQVLCSALPNCLHPSLFFMLPILKNGSRFQHDTVDKGAGDSFFKIRFFLSGKNWYR